MIQMIRIKTGKFGLFGLTFADDFVLVLTRYDIDNGGIRLVYYFFIT